MPVHVETKSSTESNLQSENHSSKFAWYHRATFGDLDIDITKFILTKQAK